VPALLHEGVNVKGFLDRWMALIFWAVLLVCVLVAWKRGIL
jgi:hypothetical protein